MEATMDTTTLDAFRAVAELLERAYRRLSVVRRMPAPLVADAVDKELEMGGQQSVHEGG